MCCIKFSDKKDIFMNNRISWIDATKALAIIAVMLSHSCGFPGSTGRYFTACLIPVFFLTAGYVVKDIQMGEGIIKKGKTLLIPYFVYSLLLLIMTSAVKVMMGSFTIDFLKTAVIGVFYSSYSFLPRAYIEETATLFVVNNAPMWFVTCLFVSFCIFYILKDCRMNKGIAVGLLIVVAYFIQLLPIRLPWSADAAVLGAVFLFVGNQIRCANVKLEYSFGNIRFVLVILISLIMYVGLCNLNPNIAMSVREYGDCKYFNIPLLVVIGCLGTFLYIILAKLLCKIPLIEKLLCYIGRRTLVILAFHVFVFQVVRELASRTVGLHEDSPLKVVIGILEIVIAVIVCCPVYDWIKKSIIHVSKGFQKS